MEVSKSQGDNKDIEKILGVYIGAGPFWKPP